MYLESEVTQLKKITDSHRDSVNLLKALNRTLLAGVGPSTIINELYFLEYKEANQPIQMKRKQFDHKA